MQFVSAGQKHFEWKIAQCLRIAKIEISGTYVNETTENDNEKRW